MKKSLPIQIFKIGIIIISFWFIGKKFWLNQDWLLSSAVNLKFTISILLCSIIYGVSQFLLSYAWRKLLIWCGHKDITINLCNKIYGKSQIAKYIPGNVFHVLGRHIMGNQYGISHIVLTAAAIYEVLGLISVSMFIGFSGMTIFGLTNIYFSTYQIIIILVTTIILSVMFTAIAPYIMSLRGINLPNRGLWTSVINLYSVYMLYFVFFLFAGLLLVFIVNIFLNINFIVGAKIIVIFSIAWIAGFIIPGAPGGIGVREAVIIFFIAPIIGEAQGVAAAIGLRFVTLLGDVWFLIISDKNFISNKFKY